VEIGSNAEAGAFDVELESKVKAEVGAFDVEVGKGEVCSYSFCLSK